MRVSEIQVIAQSAFCELRGHVTSDRGADDDGWFAPFTLWFRFPTWCEPFLSAANGDPFLAALLVPAMLTGERLTIPAPVSPKLLAALPDLQAIYASFDPHNRQIPVALTARHKPLPPANDEGVGLCFSLGVDSFYSLLKNDRDHPHDDMRVTHLLSVHGFDIVTESWRDAFPLTLLDNFQRVASEMGKTLVPVTTNVRLVIGQLAPWTMTHGAALASVALALGPLLRRVLIAASTTYDYLYPWGSHPVLDPLWSTEGLTVIHDGCEMDTIGKTRFIARSQLALDTLRPCGGYGPGYNCGRCPKCVRTMIDLFQAGALDRCRTLPHQIDPEHVRESLRLGGGQVHVLNFRRRLDGFVASGDLPEVRAVLAQHLAREEGGQIAPRVEATPSRPRRWLPRRRRG